MKDKKTTHLIINLILGILFLYQGIINIHESSSHGADIMLIIFGVIVIVFSILVYKDYHDEVV